MNDRRNPSKDDGEAMGALFQHVELREQPSDKARAAAYEALHAHWRKNIRARRRQRIVSSLALAASVVVAAGLFWLLPGPSDEPIGNEPVAHVLWAGSDAQGVVKGSDPSGTAIYNGLPIEVGDRIELRTGGALVLDFVNGVELRLSADTTLSIDHSDQVTLSDGALYFQSSEGLQAGTLAVVAPRARIQHIGTRYLVSVDESATKIAVRDGKIEMTGPDGRATAEGGERLVVNDEGRVQRESISVYGAEWQWVDESAPGRDWSGQSAHALIEWAAYESGRKVRYSSDAARIAKATEVFGVEEVSPAAALRMIPYVSQLKVDLADGWIVVSP